MAWDGALVRTFEKSPVRGVFPYVFAAVYEYIGYVPQPFHVVLDGEETVRYGDPVIFTVANLTQYGGGARIAPRACPDDGLLELIVMLEKDMPRLVTQLPRLFDGTLDEIPEVECRRFRSLVVRRLKAGPIQLDGELVQSEAEIKIDILPKALTVLVPRKPTLKERVMKTLHISK
jgi:diacylglycerol kinase family enzyme